LRALLIVCCFSTLGGCYRSAELPLADARYISPHGATGLRLERSAGKPVTFDDYDTLAVETADDTGYEFENPVHARFEERFLVVTDHNVERRFHLDEVEEIVVWQEAPERPWIIAGVSALAMLGGGLVGYAVTTCQGEFCGLQAAAGGLFGATVGLGLGLGISIPLSAHLSPERPEREPERYPGR
jgi:hypothetical protein